MIDPRIGYRENGKIIYMPTRYATGEVYNSKSNPAPTMFYLNTNYFVVLRIGMRRIGNELTYELEQILSNADRENFDSGIVSYQDDYNEEPARPVSSGNKYDIRSKRLHDNAMHIKAPEQAVPVSKNNNNANVNDTNASQQALLRVLQQSAQTDDTEVDTQISSEKNGIQIIKKTPPNTDKPSVGAASKIININAPKSQPASLQDIKRKIEESKIKN